MEIYLLEYYEEIQYKDFATEKYNLIGVYWSEREAQIAKKRIIGKRKINEEYLFVSATKIGKVQWEGGFISV